MIAKRAGLIAFLLLWQAGAAPAADIPACDPKEKAQEYFAKVVEFEATMCKQGYGTFSARIWMTREELAGCDPREVGDEFQRLMNADRDRCGK